MKIWHLKIKYTLRRVGDPQKLVASSAKIKRILGWSPKLSSLEKIIEDAYNWHKSNLFNSLN